MTRTGLIVWACTALLLVACTGTRAVQRDAAPERLRVASPGEARPRDVATLHTDFSLQGSQFVFRRAGRPVRIALASSADHWQVNCDRTRAWVLGRAWQALRPGDAPYSTVSLLDLVGDKVVTRFTVSTGPYALGFSQDGRWALSDDRAFALSDGIEVDPPPAFVQESCAALAGQQHTRGHPP